MKPVTVYSTRICPYCMLAKRLLGAKGVKYDEVMVDSNDTLRAEMMQRSGRRTVPQIFIGDRHVGGFDDLSALDRAGQLDPLLRDA
ncbi:glutaredoxin 3 [Nevskia sp.]|uniref:glutaredoxin 3 n=1 Tax=Nevskia sp. TaxID=1929292 RepID=UPI0025CE3CDD|nr:glutaredoxin 3 [Nevskia sp.]